ncbi:MAG: AtpZ/AtpI family protein [Longimicrobiales bacterium]|nr:AtpZ/AtpI family protein [Longimicrobiales bacterium]
MSKRESRPGKDGSHDAIRASTEFIGYGITFAASTLLFLLGGHWLDGKLGTSPLLALLGMFVGAAAGFWSLYSHLSGIRNPPRDGDDDDKGEDPRR